MSAAEVLALPECAQRLAIANEAACEVDALAHLLQRITDHRGVAVDGLALRGVMMRIKTLAGIVMAAVDDAADPLDELQFRLVGNVDAEGGAT